MTEQGRVVVVTEVPVGDALASDVAVGATLLNVYDATDFSETGGQIDLGGVIYTYTAKNDDLNTLTLQSPTTVAGSADDPVYMYPYGSIKIAKVQLMDNSEAIDAIVPTQLFDVLDDSVRDGDAEQESVEVELIDDDWYVTNLVGETPVILGQYIDPDSLPQPSNLPVTAIPDPVVSGGIATLFVTWDPANGTNVSVQVHIKPDVAFVPVKDDPTTLAKTVTGSGTTITFLPDGSTLQHGVGYYVALVAFNDAAPAGVVSNAVCAELHDITTEDISVDALWAGRIQADRIEAGNGIIDKIDVLGSLTAHGAAGETVALDSKGFHVRGPDALGNPTYVDFPTNGAQPNIIGGTLIGDTLEVNGTSTFHDGIEMPPGSQMLLHNITAPPTSKPAVTTSWPFYATPSGLGPAVTFDVTTQRWYGITNSHTEVGGVYQLEVYDVNFNLISITAITGTYLRTDGPCDLVVVGSSIYVAWLDSGTVYRTTTLRKYTLAGGYVSTVQAFRYGVTDATHQSAGTPSVTSSGSDNVRVWQCWDGGTSATASTLYYVDVTLSTWVAGAATSTGVNINSSGIYSTTGGASGGTFLLRAGTFDFGAQRYIVSAYTPTGVISGRVYDGAWVRQTNDEFYTAFNTNKDPGTPQAVPQPIITWDGTRFWTSASNGAYKHSTLRWTTESSVWWVGSTIYDTTGPQETMLSPLTQTTVSKRSFVSVTVGASPTAISRVYIGRGATAPAPGAMFLNATLASGAITQTFDSVLFSGTTAPLASTFLGGTPANLTSEQTGTSTITVTTGSGAFTVTATTGTFKFYHVGYPVSGAGIPDGTKINSVAANGSTAVLSRAATASATGVVLTITTPLIDIHGDGFAWLSAPVLNKAIMTATQDANQNSGNQPPLRIGDIFGSHLRIDGDEIISMASDTALGSFGLQGKTWVSWNWGTENRNTDSSGNITFPHGLTNKPVIVLWFDYSANQPYSGRYAVGTSDATSIVINFRRSDTNALAAGGIGMQGSWFAIR